MQRLQPGCDGSQASGPWAIGSGYRFTRGFLSHPMRLPSDISRPTQSPSPAPQSPSPPSPAPQLPSSASGAPLQAVAALCTNPKTFDCEKLAKARASREALRGAQAQAQAQARDPPPPPLLTKTEPRGPRPLTAKQRVRKLLKARKTPKSRESSPTSNKKKQKKQEVGPQIPVCSENTRAKLAVAVRGLVQKVAHVAMSEGSCECKSISTSKTFD